ncbi:MAG: hypothetical protein H6686_00690 [Fibrobacteria bacterium]|nr:hypothetical protein [Fibrobacteria bacterium]
MKTWFIHNPGSGSGGTKGRRAKAMVEDWLDRHASQGHVFTTTRTLEDAERLAIEAHERGFDRVVAVGGDGTINGVLNSFFGPRGELRSSAVLGVLYTGTSPDFCRSHGIPLDVGRALDAVVADPPSVVGIPVAECDLRPSPDATFSVTRRFACCANIGIGPRLAARANAGARHRWGDFLGTFLSLLDLLRVYEPMHLDMVQDGRAFRLDAVTNVFLGLTRHVASGLQVANDLDRHPGCLYKLAISGLRIRDIPRCLAILYGGLRFRNGRPMALEYFRELSVRHPGGIAEVEFDGDPAGFLPVGIRMAEQRLPLLVPGSPDARAAA